RESLDNRKLVYETLTRIYKDKASTNLEVTEARARYIQAQFELTAAEQNLQKSRDNMKLGALKDQEALAKAANDVEIARVALEIAQHDVDRCRLKSPLDGFADRVNLVPGQAVGSDQDLTKVLRLDPIHLRLDFPQERLDEVAVGQEVEVVLDSFRKDT